MTYCHRTSLLLITENNDGASQSDITPGQLAPLFVAV